eukprot:m.231510 g.231510  ORF g.231510 m.231510 type:complete len:603 (+) comp40072_c0_seq1:414-2222(+)
MGCSLQWDLNWRGVGGGGVEVAHQSTGTEGGSFRPADFRQISLNESNSCATSDGQRLSGLVREQNGRSKVPSSGRSGGGAMVLVPDSECSSDGTISTGNPQRRGRQGISGTREPLGLASRPNHIPSAEPQMGSPESRPFCITSKHSTAELLQLEAGSVGNGHGRLYAGLEPDVAGVRISPMVPSGTMFVANRGIHGFSGAGMSRLGVAGMVPPATANGSGLPSTAAGGTEADESGVRGEPGKRSKCPSKPSRLECIRRQYEKAGFSESTCRLLEASWRSRTNRNYESHFQKWVGWCDARDVDPLSADVRDILKFMADMFEEGYAYRSLNAYRSAISSFHAPVEGFPIGQHPLVSRLLKGAANLKPPQPRYASMWRVEPVLQYIRDLGQSSKLKVLDLARKVMLLALTRPSRSADLVRIDTRFLRITEEGVCYKPTGWAKQQKIGVATLEIFHPAFPEEEILCPRSTVEAYLSRTSRWRKGPDYSQLLLSVIERHRPVTSATVARWIKGMMSAAGINVDKFKAHSTRGASASAAGEAGIPIQDILAAADWRSQETFIRHYYRLLNKPPSSQFGRTVLSQESTKRHVMTNRPIAQCNAQMDETL